MRSFRTDYNIFVSSSALSSGYQSSLPLPPSPMASSCPCLLRPLFLLLVVLTCLFHPLILKSLLPSRPPIQVVPSLQPLLQTTQMINSLPPCRTILYRRTVESPLPPSSPATDSCNIPFISVTLPTSPNPCKPQNSYHQKITIRQFIVFSIPYNTSSQKSMFPYNAFKILTPSFMSLFHSFCKLRTKKLARLLLT